MPQIGWLEILAVVIIAILILGPKEFPIALKKIGSLFGKLKNSLSSFQREVASATDEIDIEKKQGRIGVDEAAEINKTLSLKEIPAGTYLFSIEKKGKERNLQKLCTRLKSVGCRVGHSSTYTL